MIPAPSDDLRSDKKRGCVDDGIVAGDGSRMDAGHRLGKKQGAGEEQGAGARDARWSRLMVLAQAGDGAAYATLLRECRPLLRQICGRRLQDPTEAEDAVQDALLTLHLIRHTYDPARSFRPWVVAIAERRAIDRTRNRARRARHEITFSEQAATDHVAAPPQGDFLATSRLRAAVAGLPEAQRIALGLTKLEELALVEASHRSGMTVGALKVATHRAIRALRQRLNGSD